MYLLDARQRQRACSSSIEHRVREPCTPRTTTMPPLPLWHSARSLSALWGLSELAVRCQQSIMRPQRVPRVRGTKQPTTLKQRDHLSNEDLQLRRQHGRHDVEAIGCAIGAPVLHQIGDLLRCARESVMPTRPGESRQQLPQGGLLPPGRVAYLTGDARSHALRNGLRDACVRLLDSRVHSALPPTAALRLHWRR